jgi:hypothetical protein
MPSVMTCHALLPAVSQLSLLLHTLLLLHSLHSGCAALLLLSVHVPLLVAAIPEHAVLPATGTATAARTTLQNTQL